MSNKAILSPFAALSLEKRIFIYLTYKNALERLKIVFVHKQYGRIAYIHVYVVIVICFIWHERISKYLKINIFLAKAAKSPRYYNPLPYLDCF